MEKYRSGHNELDSKSSCPQGHVGSNPTFSATSERVALVPIFLFHKKSVTRSTVPPFRKKSRSAHLFGCKRPHNGSLSFPTFCEFGGSTPTAEMPKTSFSCDLAIKNAETSVVSAFFYLSCTTLCTTRNRPYAHRADIAFEITGESRAL